MEIVFVDESIPILIDHVERLFKFLTNLRKEKIRLHRKIEYFLFSNIWRRNFKKYNMKTNNLITIRRLSQLELRVPQSTGRSVFP